MSTPAKPRSRNRTRKAAYEALADKSSRNMDTLEKPVIGRIVRVTHDADGKPLLHAYDKIVHDEGPKTSIEVVLEAPRTSSSAPRPVGGRIDLRKRRRQAGAWSRCKQEHVTACKHCGWRQGIDWREKAA